MITRRFLLKLGATASIMALVGSRVRIPLAARLPDSILDPTSIPKYVMPLPIPGAMPRTSQMAQTVGEPIDYYEIAVRQFQQHILPPSMGLSPTTVWGYGSANHPNTFAYPSPTIEARHNVPIRVRWINGLTDAEGNYLPHILPVDQRLHWANPAAGPAGCDSHGHDESLYTGPVPFVTHVHGIHTDQESDGHPEAWYLPQANNVPAGYARHGSWYEVGQGLFAANHGTPWSPGAAEAHYPNDQWASTLWYHDHTLGMTRLNVYAGPAGFYLLRGGPGDVVGGTLPGPAPAVGDPPGTHYYEIPLVIQDRAFHSDGSLYYPGGSHHLSAAHGSHHGSATPHGAAPTYFGNTIVVNGRTWPFLEVEARRYRFRLLNGCNERALTLRFANNLPFFMIGAEGGYLPAPLQMEQLTLTPGERADVIVDFTALASGTTIILHNVSPDGPLGTATPTPADPNTTGQVMQFRVVAARSPDLSTPPMALRLPAHPSLGAATKTRRVPVGFANVAPSWDDPITENPALNATEIWELHNLTSEMHPIHIHQAMFEVVNREEVATGVVHPPEPWERGLKDTVAAYPGQLTRIKVHFDLPGLFVWHCHILEHEDYGMMRPYYVGNYSVSVPIIGQGAELR